MPLIETKGAASAQGFGGAGAGASGLVTYIEDVFSTYLYTGNSSTQTITNGINLAGKGGLVWVKARSNSYPSGLTDSARGVNKELISSQTVAEYNNTISGTTYGISAFNNNGFSLNGDYPYDGSCNNSGSTYASWTFRKQPKFFDVVTYTGTGSTSLTVNHNLGSTPGCIIIKWTSGTGYGWYVYHRATSGTPQASCLVLNSTGAAFNLNGGSSWIVPSSTNFQVATTDGGANASGQSYVAYLFAHNAGGFGLTGSDNVISCGSCSVGDTINLGYEPQWILAKRTDTTGDWYIDDNMRGWPAAGANDNPLLANSSAAEPTGYAGFSNITSTGFTCNFNGSYIYIAIRRGPMKVPTSGTSVYKAINYAGTGTAGRSITGVGFPPDTFFTSAQEGLFGIMPNLYDRLRGGTLTLQTSSTTYEPSANNFNYTIDQDGNTIDPTYNNLNMSGKTYINWYFGRAPSFFDVVCYTGTGSNTTQTHNLGVVPELIIVKRRDTTGAWDTYSAALSNTEYLVVNTTAAKATGATRWNSTTPTSTVFSLGTSTTTNASGGTYVAYLFATCAGVSKVGTYTGTGALQTINCGFTGGVRWVMIKRTDSTGDWYVYDSTRGISSSSDPYLAMNSSAAEVTGTNYVDTDSTGFKVTAAAPAGLNANGGSFVFLAIA